MTELPVVFNLSQINLIVYKTHLGEYQIGKGIRILSLIIENPRWARAQMGLCLYHSPATNSNLPKLLANTAYQSCENDCLAKNCLHGFNYQYIHE